MLTVAGPRNYSVCCNYYSCCPLLLLVMVLVMAPNFAQLLSPCHHQHSHHNLVTVHHTSTTGDPLMLQCCTSTIFACILIIDYGRFLAYAILGPFIQFFMIPSCELDIVYTKKLQRQREIVVKM